MTRHQQMILKAVPSVHPHDAPDVAKEKALALLIYALNCLTLPACELPSRCTRISKEAEP